jgi:hypothetical protein
MNCPNSHDVDRPCSGNVEPQKAALLLRRPGGRSECRNTEREKGVGWLAPRAFPAQKVRTRGSRSKANNMPKKLYMHYNISRSDIEANDMREFLELFAPENHSSRTLRHLCDAVEFRFSGYQQEKAEPYLIPEMRRFIRLANAQLQHAFAFYSETDSSFLSLVANCHLDHLMVIDHETCRQVELQYHPAELARFIAQGQEAIRRLGERAEMGAGSISRRQQRFAAYFAKRLCDKPTA